MQQKRLAPDTTSTPDSEHLYTLESWHNLPGLYEAWNKPEEAERWRVKLAQVEDLRE
jgi:hypothetical protein